MLAYADVEGFVASGLTALNYDPLPFLDPGPATDPNVQDLVPGMMVILSLSGGAGLDSEQVFDRAGLQVRSIGDQQDYTSAEKLAQDIDNLLVGVDSSRSINSKWTLAIQRAGGPPAFLLKDNGDRYHFTCNYIWEVQY